MRAQQWMRSWGHAYPFPLRPDFIATVTVPYDLTLAEAERLGAFIRTLAVPDRAATTEGAQ